VAHTGTVYVLGDSSHKKTKIKWPMFWGSATPILHEDPTADISHVWVTF
jgi:hypothetical protein